MLYDNIAAKHFAARNPPIRMPDYFVRSRLDDLWFRAPRNRPTHRRASQGSESPKDFNNRRPALLLKRMPPAAPPPAILLIDRCRNCTGSAVQRLCPALWWYNRWWGVAPPPPPLPPGAHHTNIIATDPSMVPCGCVSDPEKSAGTCAAATENAQLSGATGHGAE